MSGRTWLVIILGVGATAVLRTIVQLELLGEWWTLAVSDFGSVLIVGTAAVFVLWVAFKFERKSVDRRIWLLAAAGVGSFAIGDLIWSHMEVIQGIEIPYPGLPDVFYTLQIALLGPAVFLGGWSHRGRTDVRGELLLAMVAVLSLLGIVLGGFLWPYVIAAADVGLGETVFSVGYVTLDIVVLLGSAIFTGLVVTANRTGASASPWWMIAAGAALLAITDTGFAWMSATAGYEAGAIVDYGWLLAHVIIAAAASRAFDVPPSLTRREGRP